MTWYRRRLKSDTWHWEPTCRWWPLKAFVEKDLTKRPKGDLCNGCRAIEKRRKKG